MTMTVLQLLRDKFPSKYVLAIIANIEDKEVLDYESTGSVLEELESMFDWEATVEGYDFWEDVVDAIIAGKQLPDLPFRAIWKPNTYLCTDTNSYLVNLQGQGEDVIIIIDMSERPRTLEARYFREQHLAFCN
jgi:hypothetical protein